MEERQLKKGDRCWNSIGVWGDVRPKCTLLDEVIHCANCHIYSESGLNFLEQDLPADYLKESAQSLAIKPDKGSNDSHDAFVFRILREWFAIEVDVIREVTEKKVIHSIPHRDRSVLHGVLNVRGEIQPCINLASMLGFDPLVESSLNSLRESDYRIIGIENEGTKWFFPVDETYGFLGVVDEDIVDAPITSKKASRTFLKGIVTHEDLSINLLDHSLIFSSLARGI